MEHLMASNQEQQMWEDFAFMADAESSNNASQEMLQPINSTHTSSPPMPALYTQDTGCISPQDTLLDNPPAQQHQETLEDAGAIHDGATPAMLGQEDVFDHFLNHPSFDLPLEDYPVLLPQTGYQMPVATQQNVQMAIPTTSYDIYQSQPISAQQPHPQMLGDPMHQIFPGLTSPPPPQGQQQQLLVTAAPNNMYGAFQDPEFIAPPAPSYPPSYMPMGGSSTYNPAAYPPLQQGYFYPPAPVSSYITEPQPQLQLQAQLSPAPLPVPNTTFASSPSINTAFASSSPFTNNNAAASSSSSSSVPAPSNSTPERPRRAKTAKPQTEQTCQDPTCSYKTCNKEEFRRHTESVHGGLRRHHCDICDSNFNDASGLSKHRKTLSHQKKAEGKKIKIDGQIRYACRFCVKQGVRAQRLRRGDHLKRHLKECKHCEKKDDGLPVGYWGGTGGMDNGMLRGTEGFDFVHREVTQERRAGTDPEFDFAQLGVPGNV